MFQKILNFSSKLAWVAEVNLIFTFYHECSNVLFSKMRNNKPLLLHERSFTICLHCIVQLVNAGEKCPPVVDLLLERKNVYYAHLNSLTCQANWLSDVRLYTHLRRSKHQSHSIRSNYFPLKPLITTFLLGLLPSSKVPGLFTKHRLCYELCFN